MDEQSQIDEALDEAEARLLVATNGSPGRAAGALFRRSVLRSLALGIAPETVLEQLLAIFEER